MLRKKQLDTNFMFSWDLPVYSIIIRTFLLYFLTVLLAELGESFFHTLLKTQERYIKLRPALLFLACLFPTTHSTTRSPRSLCYY